MLHLSKISMVASFKSGCPGSRLFCEKWKRASGGVAALLVAISLWSGCRLDMHVQPRQNPLSRSDFFTDQRSERPPVEGTVARGQLQKNTTAEHNYLRDGFFAATPDKEMKSPDLEVNVLVAMKDVTARIQGAAKGISDPAKALKARDAEEAECRVGGVVPGGGEQVAEVVEPARPGRAVGRGAWPRR